MVNGYKVISYLSKNRITQKKFAEIVGVSVPTINKVVNNNTCDLQTFVKIADAMKVSADYLLDREQKENIQENKQQEIMLSSPIKNADEIFLTVKFTKENIMRFNLDDMILNISNR